jgi:hypothetical protein
MSARRRRRSRPKSSRASAPTLTKPSDGKDPSLTEDFHRSSLNVTLRRKDDLPIPIPAISAFGCAVIVVLGIKFPGYVTCPQQASGAAPRLFSTLFLGLPVGLGITSIIMMVTTLGVHGEHKEDSASAIRIGLERGGVGAAFGTFLSTFATLNVPLGSSC